MLRKSQAFASGLIALFVISRLSAASCTYTTFTVPNSENLTAFPSGIDSLGKLGGSFQNLNGVLQGFARGADGESYTDFSVPASTFTTALGMNGNGDVIGLFALPLGQTSVYIRASNGTFTTPTLFNAPANIIDLGLNNGGQIAGALQNAGQFQSFFCVGMGGVSCE